MLVAIIASVAACSQTRHYVNGHSVEGTRKVTENTDYFIGGLAQKENINAESICGSADKVVATETVSSPLNIILRAITWGIYSPQEQSVYCKRS